MSRKIYNRLSLMAVSWLDESTLSLRKGLLDTDAYVDDRKSRRGCLSLAKWHV